MPTQLTPEELRLFLPGKPGLLAHCKRVATLANELASHLLPPPADSSILEQAALLHHWMGADVARGFDRLLSDIRCVMRPGSAETARPPKLPEALRKVLAELHGPPTRSAGDTPPTAARVIEVCNLFDEQMEWMPLEPHPVAEIVTKLEELAASGSLDQVVVTALKDLTTRFQGSARRLPEALPASSRMAHEALRTLSRPRSFELYELEKIAGQDPMLAAGVIQTANSALYGSSAAIRTLREAIGHIGTNAARRALLATALRPLMRASGLEEIWRHSLSIALWCQQIAAATGLADPEEALLLGLVHDIGRVAVHYLSPELEGAYERLLQGGCPPTYAETLLTGRDHGEIGGEILQAWNFPEALVEGVRRHHQPERSHENLAGFLYLAEFWICSEEDLPSQVWLRAAQAQTGLTLGRLESLGSEQPQDALTALLAA